DAIEAMARTATQANSTMQNIGARRLHTVLEKLLEDISFDAPYEEKLAEGFEAAEDGALVAQLLDESEPVEAIPLPGAVAEPPMKKIHIDREFVLEKLAELAKDKD